MSLVTKFLGGAGNVAMGVAEQVPRAIGGSLHYLSGIDRTFFNRGEFNLSNILGRKPKPWFMGSMVFGALGMGVGAGEKMYQQAISSPETPIPSLGYDGVPNDLNSGGLVQALHKNRHG